MTNEHDGPVDDYAQQAIAAVAWTVSALEELTAPYVEDAQGLSALACQSKARVHAAWADIAAGTGDVHAELLHVTVAQVYRAHRMAALAAEIAASTPRPRPEATP